MLFFLMIISGITELIGFLTSERHFNNMYVYHVYTVFEFVLISIFFLNVLLIPKAGLIIKIIIPLFWGVEIFDLYANGMESLDNISTTCESIIFILYATSFFYFLLKNAVYQDVLSTSVFWINTGILLYFSGNLFLFIFSNYLERESERVSAQLWCIHSILNILFYLLISIGFWKTKKP